MTFNLNIPAKIIAGLFISASLMTLAHADTVNPPNLKEVANMNFDQRMAVKKQLHSALLKATPQEKIAFNQKLADQMRALTPADLEYLHEKWEANTKALTPEQKNAVRAEQKAYFNALPPEEQAAIKAYYLNNAKLHYLDVAESTKISAKQ